MTPGMEAFGGVHTNNPAASMADFAANHQSLLPDNDYTLHG